MDPLDLDAVVAAADLVDRCGGRGFEIGYLEENVPSEEARWYCSVRFKGRKLIVDEKTSPIEAAEGLARELLTGAKCRCGKLVALSPGGAVMHGEVQTMADGSTFTAEEARTVGQCLWTRKEKRWEPGCDAPPIRIEGGRF